MAKVCPACELTYSDDDFFCAADGSPLRSTGAERDNLVGTVIAERYRVEAVLGEGGMGRVYRARHVRVPREAAIKVLRRALIADPYAVAAFNREAQNAASVGDHPNVASVYDFGETPDGLVFLAMEYVDGETLSHLLQREPVLGPRRAVEIVRQIAAGLTAAHELPEPVVHRDLKPDNILLKETRDGGDWVKVVDFGIAKAVKRDTQLLTTPGLVVGTPRYMSPEQLTGAAVDVRTDVYALGLIAFQMLTGGMPFASSSPQEESSIQWALQRLTHKPLALADARPDIPWPAGAQAVFDHALASDPAARTPTASELARSLGRAFGFVTPSSVLGAVAEVARPAPTASASVGPAGGATAPVTWPPSAPDSSGATRPVTPAAGESIVPPPVPEGNVARPRRRWAMIGVVGGVLIAAAAVFAWQRGTTGALTREGSSATAVPNDSVNQPGGGPAAEVSPLATSDSSTSRVAVADSTTRVTQTPASTTPEPAPRAPRRSTESTERARPPGAPRAARVRASLDNLKAALADPDAVAAAGNGPTILATIDRLLPTLTGRADSVEATYYAVETNLILDRPAAACRLLLRLQPKSRGTVYEGRVERFLADSALGCASRR